LSHSTLHNRRYAAGFTLIEVLIAIAVVAVSLTAIGSLMAASIRGTLSLEQHLALVETTRAIATGLPSRGELKLGNISGNLANHRWRVDVTPFAANNVNPRLPTPWVPQEVVIRVQSPGGPIMQVNTVRLRRRTDG
jgi:general secretion pathway protein I